MNKEEIMPNEFFCECCFEKAPLGACANPTIIFLSPEGSSITTHFNCIDKDLFKAWNNIKNKSERLESKSLKDNVIHICSQTGMKISKADFIAIENAFEYDGKNNTRKEQIMAEILISYLEKRFPLTAKEIQKIKELEAEKVKVETSLAA